MTGAAGIPDVPAGFDTSDESFRADPYAAYRELRGHGRVFRTPEGSVLLTRHADAWEVLHDQRFSSNPVHAADAGGGGSTGLLRQAGSQLLLFMDPPDHTRIRGLVSKAFTPRRVEELRPRIEQLVDSLLDEVDGKNGMDVIDDLAYPLPVMVICELLGVPAEDRDQFKQWSSDASRMLDLQISEEEGMRGLMAGLSLAQYFTGLFAERRLNPHDDMVTALVQAEEAGDRLSESELFAIMGLLFVAGHETTMNLIANGTLALLRNPREMARLREDPTLLRTGVEEFLRYDPPVQITGRFATQDTDVNGIPVAKGESVITPMPAANRDPEEFADPDRLDVGRVENRHLTFSAGIHYCLGAALARLEGQVVFGRLVERFPTLELATDTLTYRPHFVLRGLAALPVGW